MFATLRWAVVLAVPTLIVCCAMTALGQTQPPPAQSKQAPPAKQKPQQAPAAPQSAVPDANTLVILIQNTIIAANQANLTGNYMVLHALAAPAFQSANSPEKLAEIFANLRNQRIDMSPIVLYLPKLSMAPGITEQGMLRLIGAYDTQPKQVHFDLLFQLVAGQWKMFGISLGTSTRL
jgi:hypothetical protein